MARILLVDDEKDFRISVAEVLRASGHEVGEAGTAEAGLDRIRGEVFDAVIADLRMPGRSGIDLLKQAALRLPDAILVVMTAFGSLETAIEALRLGAHDYLLKPIPLEALRRKIEALLQHRAALAENRWLRRALAAEAPPAGLVGESPLLQEALRLIARVAPTGSTVLITGETGTGKELVARAVHEGSPRRDRPFLAINCGSVPETLLESELFGHVKGAFTGADRDKRGLFEVAEGGTLFLDEIGEMPLSLQPKILRALETREALRVGATVPFRMDVRLVAATNRDLRGRVKGERFRSDLYFRLAVFEIPLPPLRERPGDIPALSRHLIDRLSRTLHRPPAVPDAEAMRALERYAWPGNVRELANVLERALILCEGDRIVPTDLPGILTAPGETVVDDLRLARLAFERAHIRRVVEKMGGDKKAAAEALGIDVSSLYRKIEGGGSSGVTE
ncbi:MAG: sigma-54-dependent Fis family transcriptional regulator [Planctomycetes bacterium]|nr:sigma-54-dependent Fis family transcriptional regulator [Planctomycetota bacterium]